MREREEEETGVEGGGGGGGVRGEEKRKEVEKKDERVWRIGRKKGRGRDKGKPIIFHLII